jgi:hypothetical protein
MPKKGAPIREKQSRLGKVSRVARGRPLADKGYRLVFSKTGTNKYQAQTGMVKLLNNGSVVSEAQAFSGGNGHPAIEDGVYRVHLDIRGDESTNQTQGKAPNVLLAPFNGIQKLGDNVPDGIGNFYNFQGEWGHMRVRLIPKSGPDKGDYLHGKLLPKNWTHGCVCDKTETVIQHLWNISGPQYPILNLEVATATKVKAKPTARVTPETKTRRGPLRAT